MSFQSLKLSSLLFASLPRWFQMTFLHIGWFFILSDQVCCRTSLVSSSTLLLCFSAPKFVSFFFYSFSLLIFSFCSCIISLMLSVFSFSSLGIFDSYFKFFVRQFLALHFLRSVFGVLFCSFDWAIFPCFFICLVIFYWDLGIWKNNHF